MFKNYAYYYDAIYSQKNYAKEVEQLSSFFARLGPQTNSNRLFGQLVECGCGTGGHAPELIKKSSHYAGIDISGDMLELCGQKLAKSNQQFTLHKMDLSQKMSKDSQAQVENRFDTAMSLFHVLSYMTNQQQVDSFFSNIHQMLRPQGHFLFDFWYAPGVQHLGLEKRIKKFEIPQGKCIRTVTPQYPTHNTVNIHITLDIHNKNNELVEHFEEHHPMRFFTSEEIEAFLAKHRFKLITLRGENRIHEESHPNTNDWGALALVQKI